MLKSWITFLALCLLWVVLCTLCGCETENPLCTDTYCIQGEIFLKSDLKKGQKFEKLPATVDEATLTRLFTVDVGEYDFKPILVTGLADWDFRSTDWEYRKDGVSYLKKLTLEFEADDGQFGSNRIILVHLNKDTVSRDRNFVEWVDFLGTVRVRLTHHTGIATFKGDVVGAPTR